LTLEKPEKTFGEFPAPKRGLLLRTKKSPSFGDPEKMGEKLEVVSPLEPLSNGPPEQGSQKSPSVFKMANWNC